MSNQPFPADGDDFTARPPSPAFLDEGVRRAEPETPAPLPTSLLEEPRPLDFQRKPTLPERAFRWLLAVVILPSVALGSWFAGGNDVWRIGTALGVLILIILGLVALRHLGSLPRRSYYIFGYLLVCWGTWFVIGYFWPQTTIQVKGSLSPQMEREPTTPLRVRYDGKPMVERDRTQECAFSFRGPFDPKRLQIESLAPEGWIPRQFTDFSDSVSLEAIPVTSIYVDNRGNGPTVLSCGEVSFDIPAREKVIHRVPELRRWLRCPVLLDEQEVGSLTDKNILIDTLGTRSYTQRTILYGGFIEMLQNKPVPGAESVWFERKLVHALPGQIDFFLEPAPEEIKVPAFGGIALGTEKRTQLLEDDP